jgi:hypothetical protein
MPIPVYGAVYGSCSYFPPAAWRQVFRAENPGPASPRAAIFLKDEVPRVRIALLRETDFLPFPAVHTS